PSGWDAEFALLAPRSWLLRTRAALRAPGKRCRNVSLSCFSLNVILRHKHNARWNARLVGSATSAGSAGILPAMSAKREQPLANEDFAPCGALQAGCLRSQLTMPSSVQQLTKSGSGRYRRAPSRRQSCIETPARTPESLPADHSR